MESCGRHLDDAADAQDDAGRIQQQALNTLWSSLQTPAGIKVNHTADHHDDDYDYDDADSAL